MQIELIKQYGAEKEEIKELWNNIEKQLSRRDLVQHQLKRHLPCHAFCPAKRRASLANRSFSYPLAFIVKKQPDNHKNHHNL